MTYFTSPLNPSEGPSRSSVPSLLVVAPDDMAWTVTVTVDLPIFETTSPLTPTASSDSRAWVDCKRRAPGATAARPVRAGLLLQAVAPPPAIAKPRNVLTRPVARRRQRREATVGRGSTGVSFCCSASGRPHGTG